MIDSYCVHSYLIPFEEDISFFFYFGLLICAKLGKEKKLFPKMAFGDGQLTSAADSVHMSGIGLNRLYSLAHSGFLEH